MAKYQSNRRRLLKEVVCPHCWATFEPEDVLWIAEDPTLVGDDRLGESERIRFLPTEYDEFGTPVDARGATCRDMACPRCHLKIPAPALDSPPVFMSIVGAPACGKSYYLASSTWSLRRTLPSRFQIAFTDADPAMNHRIRQYESLQYEDGGRGLVRIDKTQEQGDLYDAVRIGEQTVVLPQPFVFLAAKANEPSGDDPDSKSYSRMICLYDNAGESYLPSNDLSSSPVTRHLLQSKCVFFLYDPTQDAQFRREYVRRYHDATLFDSSAKTTDAGIVVSQEAIFVETARRIRSLRHMTTNDRFNDLLVVIVPKADVWARLSPNLAALLVKNPYSRRSGSELYGLRIDKVETASRETRELLSRLTPAFISTVESFAKDVVYIPVSATGVPPSVDAETNASGFRVEDMKPVWATAPMLYALSRLAPDLVPAGRASQDSSRYGA